MSERDKAFTDAILDGEKATDVILGLDSLFQGSGSVDRAIEWFRENMSPQDVFDREALDAWAKMNGYEGPKP